MVSFNFQIKDEVRGVLEVIKYTYDAFGFGFEAEAFDGVVVRI